MFSKKRSCACSQLQPDSRLEGRGARPVMSFYDDRKKDDKLGKVVDPVVRAVKWVQTRSPKEKGIMLGAAAVTVVPDLLLGVPT